MVGHIKIDRKILDWEWYQDLKVFHFFLYLLLRANHKDGNWQGISIKRGQVVIGRTKSSKHTALTENEIRTCIKKLKLTKEITTKSTNKYTIVTICKYDFYQSGSYTVDQQINQQNTNKTPTNNQPLTTNNNVNNNKEDNTATAVVEMGIVLVKKIANEVWTDKAWVEALCMGNGMGLTDAKNWMQQFNLSISQDNIPQFDSRKYKKMFQGWLRTKLGGGQRVTKIDDEKKKEKEMMKRIGL